MTRTVRIALALGAISAAMLFANEPGKLLGPLDPMAADGSFEAGRALTMSDLDPSPEPALPDLDDPAGFEERFSRSSVERDRDAIMELAGPLGPALCEPDRRQPLIAAIRAYYSTKQYLTEEFHFRGPRAGQFIDAAWTTSKDRQIEAFVQSLLDSGYLRTRETWPRERSFLRDLFAPKPCSRS
jgi:hypothetical protein